MMRRARPCGRFWNAHPLVILGTLTSFFLLFLYFQPLIYTLYTLLSLPFAWWRNADAFIISPDRDGFDITFANYSVSQDTAGPQFPDKIPSVLHHIALGSSGAAAKWEDARRSCLEMHPGWETHLWTDEEADQFVAERFPHIKRTWDAYRYPIQRIDALRYLVLYHYGGAILDMDLQCKRSLGPLRRFQFVAAAAHPVGFSNGFMMASQHNPFIREIIHSLRTYNRHWFGLPYPTVMFSTGCHFASTIHSLQRNRTELKILAGPKTNFKLHSLNGAVSTPLFDHLGSSSWHSFDAALIVALGHVTRTQVFVVVAVIVCAVVFVARTRARHRRDIDEFLEQGTKLSV